eukprot:8317_1
MECWDVLWKEIEELCNDDNNRHEIVMNYLNVPKKVGLYEDDTALMISLQIHDKRRPGSELDSSMDDDSMMYSIVENSGVSDLFFKVMNCYPSLLSKQDALKMKNQRGEDALQILKRNYWNETDKGKAMREIETILEMTSTQLSQQTMPNMETPSE